MNSQLQAILDAIENTVHLSEAEKELLIKSVKDADKAQSMSQFKLERLEKDKQTLSVMLEENIEDLQKKSDAIEAQNRELEIESALEKVRSAALSMKEPADMLDVCHIISDQLELLHVKNIQHIGRLFHGECGRTNFFQSRFYFQFTVLYFNRFSFLLQFFNGFF